MAEAGLLEARLETLVGKYARLIDRVARRVGGGRARAHAEDIAQEVALNLWRQVAREQTIDHPVSYIYRCAVRETLRVLRREAPYAEDGAGQDEPDPPATAGDPAGELQSKVAAQHIAEALRRLAPDRRRAVKAHLAGFDVREIMEMHDWPYQKARNLIARGTADLRSLLRERGIDGT